MNRRATWLITAAGVLLALVPLASIVHEPPAWLQRLWQSPAERRLAALVEAVGDRRYLEARLTGFRHGPLQSEAGGANENLSVLAAAGAIQRAADTDPTHQNLHAWGVAQLLAGEPDGAIASLERAVAGSNGNARYESDLSAAYLTRANVLQRADDLPRALAAAERAIDHGGAGLEAYFNRALSLESLHLSDQARDAWAEYAARDGSAWADEAKRRSTTPALPDLDARARELESAFQDHRAEAADLVAHSADRAWKYGEAMLPGEWAEAVSRGDPQDARRLLGRGRELADALAGATGDPALLEHYRFLAQLHGPPLAMAAKAHADYASGLALVETYRFQEAVPLLKAAYDRFRAMGAPLDYTSALSYTNALRLVRAMPDARRVLDGRQWGDRSAHRCVQATELRLQGLIAVAEGRYSRAVGDYLIARERYERCGLTTGELQASIVLGEVSNILGSADAWAHLLTALRLVDIGASPRILQPAFFVAASTAMSAGLPEVALRFNHELIRAAERLRLFGAMAEARLSRARTYMALNQPGPLAEDLQVAEKALLQSEDEAHRNFVLGEWLTIRAEQLIESDPSAARVASEQALEHAARTQRAALVPRVMLARARALARLDQPALADQVYLEGIDAFEAQWKQLTGQSLRVSHFDLLWDLYRERALLLASNPGTSREALATVERSQARTLLAQLGDGPEWSLELLEQRLHPDAAIVYLLPGPKGTVGWLIRQGSTTQFSADVSDAEIQRLARDTAWVDNGRAVSLGTRLLQPVERSLADHPLIGVVAPGKLALLPWAAVTVAGAPLSERSTVMLVPSTAVMLRNQAKALQPEQLRILSVGIGGSVRDGATHLPSLPSAEREAAALRDVYGDGTVLTGASATRAAVLQALRTHHVFHFAGHAVAHEAFPDLSRLVLNGQGVDSAIFGRELAGSHTSLRLAVLSACGTASGLAARSEGPLSIARAFLAAGVGTVIATTGDVTDAASARFGQEFHRALRKTGSISSAFRHAQAALRSSPVDSTGSEWTRFVLIGAPELLRDTGGPIRDATASH